MNINDALTSILASKKIPRPLPGYRAAHPDRGMGAA